MPSVAVQEFTATLTAAGGATGELTVDDNSGLFPGTLGWLWKPDGSSHVRVKIVSVRSTDRVTVRSFQDNNENAPPSYGRSNLSTFVIGDKLTMEAQTAPVDPAFEKRRLP